MNKNLVIKNIIFIVGILLAFGMFSQFVIPNHIERTEEQREQSDIEMIETMQRAVNTALESEDVRDATGSLINSYGKCEIWLGKTTSIRFELLKKTLPELYDATYKQLEQYTKCVSLAALSSEYGLRMVIDDDYNVLISIESSYGQVTQCKYIKDQFKRV